MFKSKKERTRYVHVDETEVELTVRIPRSLYDQVVEKLNYNGSDLESFVRMSMRGLCRFHKPFDLGDKITFGKYRDEVIETIIRNDADYIEYCIREVQGFRLTEAAVELLQEVEP